MSRDPRSPVRPLEALHERESWRLDALRAELAAATRRLDADRAAHGRLEVEQRAALGAASPTVATAIDPLLARSRLLHLSAIHARLEAAVGAVGQSGKERQRLIGDSLKQHARLDSIGRQRDALIRAEAARIEARQADEVDHGWLAGQHWRDRASEDTRSDKGREAGDE